MVPSNFKISDTLWEIIEKYIPRKEKNTNRGRKPIDARKIADGLFYVFRTGCQWKAAPNCFGSPSTLHRYFQKWVQHDVFSNFWTEGLLEYDEEEGIHWKWQSIDASTVKAPLGGEKTGPNPTDRGKNGTKRSIIVDGNGVPISLVVSGANRHDSQLLENNLENVVLEKLEENVYEDYLCGDKAYDSEELREIISKYGRTPKIKYRSKEIEEKKRQPWKKARRWVVERTFSWFNRFRKILIRWEKKPENYVAILHFACGYICLKASRILG